MECGMICLLLEGIFYLSGSIVTSNACYKPWLLDDFDNRYFNLDSDALRQHHILNIHAQLVPPWRMWQELTPGSVMLFDVALHAKNVNVNPKDINAGFYRVCLSFFLLRQYSSGLVLQRYEIRGLGGVVVIPGTSEPERPAEPLIPLEYLRYHAC